MQAGPRDARLGFMAIDMHTHFVPPQMSDALCQRTETPWIDSMPNTGWPSDGVQE